MLTSIFHHTSIVNSQFICKLNKLVATVECVIIHPFSTLAFQLHTILLSKYNIHPLFISKFHIFVFIQLYNVHDHTIKFQKLFIPDNKVVHLDQIASHLTYK